MASSEPLGLRGYSIVGYTGRDQSSTYFTVIIDVTSNNAVVVKGVLLDLLVGPVALTLTVSNPNTQDTSFHALEEDTVALLETDVDETTLETTTLVVDESRP